MLSKQEAAKAAALGAIGGIALILAYGKFVQWQNKKKAKKLEPLLNDLKVYAWEKLHDDSVSTNEFIAGVRERMAFIEIIKKEF